MRSYFLRTGMSSAGLSSRIWPRRGQMANGGLSLRPSTMSPYTPSSIGQQQIVLAMTILTTPYNA
eukprot:scaffold34098_cov30-Prasinocladus_malaysianus.AAC.1